MTTHDRQEKQDEDIHKESKDATVSHKEATSRDNNLHKEKESSSEDKLNVILDTCNGKDNLEATKKANQLDHSNETVAAIKETTDDLEGPKATHPQIDNNTDPPVSSGEDLEDDVPWIDDEPWEHAFYVGGSYPK